MLRDRKIAVFIDVDNAVLDNERYAQLMNQIRTMGEVVCASVYNASERKHKAVIEDARQHGYSILLSATGRRRARKSFDTRIFVDVATLVTRNTEVDTIAIISAPTDLVYLFSYLRRLGMQIIAGNDLEEQSAALVSEKLDLGRPVKAKPAPRPAVSRPAPAKPVPAKPAPAKAAPVKPAPAPKEEPSEDKTAELLRQIERLRMDYESTSQRAESRPAPKAEPNIVDETRNLINKISELEGEQSEGATDENGGPRAVYVSQNDSDLIRKIEELRKQNEGSESDDLVAEIKKLLDGLE